jgi:hypothetical protein
MRGMTLPPFGAAGGMLTGLPRRAWTRFRQLRRAKQMLVLLLALLDVILASATALYAWEPALPAAPAASAPPASGMTSVGATGDALTGIYLAEQGQALLVLRQYDGAVTGELTQVTCSHGRAQRTERIVTGQALTGDLMRLTYSTATLAHSTTVAYHLTLDSTGFVLTWHDAHGHPHSQAWTRGSAMDLVTHCNLPLTKATGG